MRVIEAVNVHQALPPALNLLRKEGVRRESRNGPVLVAPWPVTTVYQLPSQRVMFWPERDANPALHLYESLWMLQGRNDVAPLLRYAKQFSEYTDDGTTLHGAYGHRWRHHFGFDQLGPIVERLKANPEDRRCVLGMWDPKTDLDRNGKDVPCNDIVTFQRDYRGRLDMAVFCRSNDIIWGAYGANAVHFSFLQEYVATHIGCPVGTYSQISVNWHAYLKTLEPLGAIDRVEVDPYQSRVLSVHMPYDPAVLDKEIDLIVGNADGAEYISPETTWGRMVDSVLRAHHLWKTLPAPERFTRALEHLKTGPAEDLNDWTVATREWIQRRQTAWEKKQ